MAPACDKPPGKDDTPHVTKGGNAPKTLLVVVYMMKGHPTPRTHAGRYLYVSVEQRAESGDLESEEHRGNKSSKLVRIKNNILKNNDEYM